MEIVPWAKSPVHVIESKQFSRDDLDELARRAKVMEKMWQGGGCLHFADCRARIVFFQPSTRTFASSLAAAHYLGMPVVYQSESAGVFSSAVKGESLEDTLGIHIGYDHDPASSILVLRHDEGSAAKRSVKIAQSLANERGMMHIVNAGCGKADGQHPTQALLDTTTIIERYGSLEKLTYGLMGDLRNGRTVRSLLYHLGNCRQSVKVFLFSPPSLKLGDDIKDHLAEKQIQLVEVFDRATMIEALAEIDVLYVTRFQREDLTGEDAERFEEYQRTFQVNREVRQRLGSEAVIMHPLPHNREISNNTTRDPRYIAMRQAQIGLFVRMALYATMLRGHDGFARWQENVRL